MTRIIKQIRFRRPEQSNEDPDLVLTVGQSLPLPYHIGRPFGALVQSIEKLEGSYECTLTNGDPIWIPSAHLTREVIEG